MKLRSYQERIIAEAPAKEGCCLFLDMGTGKTAISLNIMINRGCVRMLIVAPLRVARLSWQTEIEKWGNPLLPVHCLYDMTASNVCSYLQKPAYGYFLINYDKLKACMTEITSFGFDCIVYDESTRLKDPNTQVSKAARYLAVKNSVPYTIIMSGTPAPEALYNLWSQVFTIDKGLRLGDNYNSFIDKFFYKSPTKVSANKTVNKLMPFETSMFYITRILSKISFVMSMEEAESLPDFEEHDVIFKLTQKEAKAYAEAMKYVIELDYSEITIANAAVVLSKLLQISSGFVYSSDGGTWVNYLGNSKLEALLALYEQMGKCIVVYVYRGSLEMIKNTLDKERIQYFNADQLEEFREAESGILLLQPQSDAYGLNLQFCNQMIFFDMTWSYEKHQQVTRRIRRLGQDKPQHYWYLINCDVCQEIRNRLINKHENAIDILRHIKDRAVF